MPANPKNPLPYAPANLPGAKPKLTLKQWLARIAFVLLVLIIIRAMVFGPFTSAQVRLDTGDIRYNFYGIPVRYLRTPEPNRTALLAIAHTSTKLPDEWVWIEFGGNHNPDMMCRETYLYTSAWASVDPVICRLAMEDSADFFRTQYGRGGLPLSRSVASPFVVLDDLSGTVRVEANWKSDQGVQGYCHSRGYVIP